MTKVKICGLVDLPTAQAAVQAGADYLGFVLVAGSKRAVTVAETRAITRVLRDYENCPLLVGVFVNEPLESMLSALSEAQLDAAQLHGEEVPALIGERTSPLYGRAYKALRPTSLTEARAEAAWYVPPEWNGPLPSLLVDAYHPGQRGGSGVPGDWSLASKVAEEVPGLMLAGGLTPRNVARAIARVRPFAVDVSSGVESSPGRKDADLIRAFVAAVRRADSAAAAS